MNDCPSVTEVLSPWADFSSVPPDRLEQAADRGTRVHALCAAHAKGLYIPEIPEDCKGYLGSFKAWFKAMVREVLFVEEEFIHPVYRYKGHPDVCVVLNDGSRALIDLKTPVELKKLWRGQIAGYFELVKQKFKIDKGGTLRLDPDGGTAKMQWYTETAVDLMYFSIVAVVIRFILRGLRS